MISKSCILMAKEKLGEIGVFPAEIHLGQIILKDTEVNEEKLSLIEEVLESLGFELIKRNENMLISNIQKVIRTIVFQMDERPSSNYSHFFKKQLGSNIHICQRNILS